MSGRETLVREISTRLLDAGIKAYPPHFPYGIHHEYYRTRLKQGRRHARLAEISGALVCWADARENDDYVWQAVCGFLLSYFAEKPEHRNRLPSDIEKRMMGLEWGNDFLAFARTAISQPA
jgi:hypothetical protein